MKFKFLYKKVYDKFEPNFINLSDHEIFQIFRRRLEDEIRNTELQVLKRRMSRYEKFPTRKSSMENSIVYEVD